MSKTHLPPDIVRRYATALGVMVDRNADWTSRERLWDIAAHMYGREMWQGSIDVISFRVGLCVAAEDAFAEAYEDNRACGEMLALGNALLRRAGVDPKRWREPA